MRILSHSIFALLRSTKRGIVAQLGAAILGIFSCSQAIAEELTASVLEIQNACSSLERVAFPPSILPEWREAYYQTILGKKWENASSRDININKRVLTLETNDNPESKKSDVILALAHAFTLRKKANTTDEKKFSEYWVGRALYLSRMQHLAHAAFSQIAFSDSHPMQMPALQCLLAQIKVNPALEMPENAFSLLSDIATKQIKSSDAFQTVGEGLIVAFEQMLSRGKLAYFGTQLDALEKNFQQMAAYQSQATLVTSYLRGFYFSKEGKFEESIRHLEALANSTSLPTYLKNRIDSIYIQLARSAFSVKKFDVATKYLRLVSKQNNDLGQVLSELGWAYLQNEKFGEAIGAAINLHQGGLKRTFEPEAPMVMAMAYNELCQFPDSIRAIAAYQKGYRREFDWLSNWRKESPKYSGQYYQLMVNELKSDAGGSEDGRALASKRRAAQGGVPVKLMGEWLRHPYFLAGQEDINFWIREDRVLKEMRILAERKFSNLLTNIAQLNAKLKVSIPKARSRLKAGEGLPYTIRYELSLLKDRLTELQRMKSLAPLWNAIEGQALARSANSKKLRVSEINQKIHEVNHRLFSTLEEIADNLQLVEVEIYNSATQDLIWQNANPEYEGVAKELKEKADRSAAENEWHWGRTVANIEEDADSDEATGEVWEDELGNFRANLVDNCSNKERFLAVKATARRK